MSRAITLYLHVHQPFRIRPYSIFNTAHQHDYFSVHDGSNQDNRAIFLKVADKSYRPMNRLLLELLETHPDLRFSLSITGVFVEQAAMWAPDVLESFRQLVASGRVEIVGETYYHSLAFFYSRREFERQVRQHSDMIEHTFGVRPTAFRNTELAYNDDLASWADTAGYQAIIAEGWDSVLGWRNANYVYRPAGTSSIRLLLKNYRLSDDIAFRFGNKAWSGWPLTAQKYVSWVDATLGEDGSCVNLFMDYETFGEHQWEDTGIFGFFGEFIAEWLKKPDHTFYTVTDAAHSSEPRGEISMPYTVTWADTERDLSAWLGNSMQEEAMRHIYALESDVYQTGDHQLISDWQKLLTSDHAYYMCTKWFNDGDVHAYFSPYDSPYDAFMYFMNALRDIRFRVMVHAYGESV
jgi:alpha-amylase